MTINADNAVTDFPTFKHLLFLYKELPDGGKMFLIVLCISEWFPVLLMNIIPLYKKLFKKSDHTALEHPCSWGLPFSFLAVWKIGLWHIRIFVAQTPYSKIHTMPADMPVKPFNTFPKLFHICGVTHVTFIACDISHTHVKVVKIRFPIRGQYLLIRDAILLLIAQTIL